ncbi:leucyl/phenylalanyl-tRNA--protein transferase [Roseovarius sp. LXJ103]|uniref:leucyl/phenylalanyl-tRNA--protein transferase n=1 Tax=Roseovarius carneus TaxID=2853164 RepID=UPI000D607E9D|nr:leucyl/phenylalanyl-tRNA--protein transferase [Roseovarius carneus]MBZ8118765.1 leucyl/phenylalanyl-tRNA--protein transferase [Roseovarius carneus]PWE35563.1 leucyl/phenylalanyl-tRNA--protein transferase [Pelagicola sp. LXJ1103]
MKDDNFTLTPALLLNAYAAGIFPMAESREDPEIYWVDPKRRGILPLDGFHISRSLARRMRRGGYTVSLNADFEGVVDGCAARDETWISAEIRSLYSALHHMGHAHSLEVWEGGALTGGVYGVALQSAFFGESMFSARVDGSKRALAHLVDHLRRCGFTLFDTQFITSHLESLGAKEISRSTYHLRLELALATRADIHAVPLDADTHSVLQRMTQTS